MISKAIRLKMNGKRKQRTKTKLFVVGPHAKNEHSLFFLKYFVNKPVLDIYSAGVATEQVAPQAFAGWWILKGIDP